MKNKIDRLNRLIKDKYQDLKVNKTKYYWKRKYYKLLKEKRATDKRNETLSEDLRRMYCQKNNYKHYWYRFCILLNMIAKKEVQNEK